MVPSFTGSCAITTLPFYPLRFLESEEKQTALETRLATRGRQWQLMITAKMAGWICKGAVTPADDDGEPNPRDSEQRMIRYST